MKYTKPYADSFESICAVATRLAIFVVVWALVFCAPTSATSLNHECRTIRIGDDYFFVEFVAPSRDPRAPSSPVPVPIGSFSIWKVDGERRLLWTVRPTERSTLYFLRYGEVPDGYRQEFPVRGRPGALGEGEYDLECLGSGRFRIGENGVLNVDAE